MDEQIRKLERDAKRDPIAQTALDIARARTVEGRPKMVWDRPELKLEDLTREQLIAHCNREAAYQRSHGNKTAEELKTKITQLESANYNLGYILDKVWDNLSKHGNLDPKTYAEKEPKKIIDAFWTVVHKLQKTQKELDEVSVYRCAETQVSSNKLVRRCLLPIHAEGEHQWSAFKELPKKDTE